MDGELPGNFCRTLTDMEYLSVLPTSVEIMSELNDPGRSARQIGVHKPIRHRPGGSPTHRCRAASSVPT